MRIKVARKIFHYSATIQLVKMNLLHLLFTCSTFLLISFTPTEGTLDLSNVDLGDVKFFKYPQRHIRTGEVVYGRHQPFNIVDPLDNFNRVKAMMAYFAEVIFGGAKHKREIAVYFHPDTGTRSRFSFQQKFGHLGERLIAALGNGCDFIHHKRGGSK